MRCVTTRAMAVRCIATLSILVLLVGLVAAFAAGGGAGGLTAERISDGGVAALPDEGAHLTVEPSAAVDDDCADSSEPRLLGWANRSGDTASEIEIRSPADASAVAERAAGPFQLTDPPPPPTTTTTTTTTTPTVPSAPPVPADSGAGRRIVYSKSDQRVWLVDAGERVERTYLVSGSRAPDLPTPGEYSVFSRSETSFALSNPHIVWRFMVRFATGPVGDNIGFHEIPVDERTGQPVQTEAQLGQPLSAGCVRQATSDAVYLWNWAPIGTTVVVLP